MILFDRMMDFDDGLTPDVQQKIRRTCLYRRYVLKRKHAEELASEICARGGTLSDPALLSVVAELEALGHALQRCLDGILAGK